MGVQVRLRVAFEDANVLRGSQRRRGLHRCWLQLRPGIVTIGDLTAHLQHTFALHTSCPNGLILSIDGFVLPSFESTCILKDGDIIMIKKNGVVFQDISKLCGGQNQEPVLQSRQISAFNNRNVAILDAQVDSQGDEKDTALFSRSKVHIETPPSKQINERCNRKRSNKHQGSSNTLAIKDPQADTQGGEQNVGLHGNITHTESTSDEIVNVKCKKKHANEHPFLDSLANKDSQANSPVDIGDLCLPIPHKETSSSEMIKLNKKRKHFDKLQGSDDTLAIKDSQADSQGGEQDIGLHGNKIHKESTSNETVNIKRKKKNSNEHSTLDSLATKNSLANSPKDIGDLCLPIPQKETSSSEMIKLNRKRKHFDKLHGSDNNLAVKDSQADSQGGEQDVGLHVNITHKESTSNETVNIKHKKKHSNEHPFLDSLANKDSQADSLVYIGDLCLPIPHKETSSSEMIKLNRKRKHFDKLQGSDDTMTSKGSQRNSQREEEDNGLHGNIAHKDAASNKMMHAKYKRKHSNKPQGLDDTLAFDDSQLNSNCDEENVGLHGNIESLTTISNEMKNAKCKKNDTNKHHISENESKGNDYGHVSKNDSNGDASKVVSRSARRKKAKKLFCRAFGSKKEKKLTEVETPDGDNQKKTPEHANADQITDVDKEIVPVIVRPGHIRFESSDTHCVRADQLVHSVVQETFQWNGTTCKKKGQKLGKENTFNKWNSDTSNWSSYGETSYATEAEIAEISNEKSAVEKMDAYKESIVDKVEPVNECNGNSVAKEFDAAKELIEFESFSPLLRRPVEGDVLVYRLIELSSLWSPELSPFRVGKVSSYDSSSSKVILRPVPEYPLVLEEISEEAEESKSLYEEDGTLVVDFASLVDVRLFKAGKSMKTTPSTTPIEMQNVVLPVNNQESAPRSNDKIEISSNHTENDQPGEDWETINLALNEKKSQLQMQIGLDKKNSSLRATATTGPSSHRALRRNALGPTLALLRSSNGDSGK